MHLTMYDFLKSALNGSCKSNFFPHCEVCLSKTAYQTRKDFSHQECTDKSFIKN